MHEHVTSSVQPSSSRSQSARVQLVHLSRFRSGIVGLPEKHQFRERFKAQASIRFLNNALGVLNSNSPAPILEMIE